MTGVLPASRLDHHGDLDRCLRLIDTNMKRLITETEFSTDCDWDGTVDRDLMDRLVQVGLRQRHPGFESLRILRDVSDQSLIGQLEGSGPERSLGPGRNRRRKIHRDNG